MFFTGLIYLKGIKFISESGSMRAPLCSESADVCPEDQVINILLMANCNVILNICLAVLIC